MAKEVKIDVDKAIAKYNYEHPLDPIKGRRDLLDKIDSNLTEMSVHNWSKGKVPEAFKIVAKICDFTEITFDELITVTDK